MRTIMAPDAARLYTEHSAIVSLYLGLDDVPSPWRTEQRWHALRTSLAADDAPAADLVALDDVVADAAAQPGDRVLAAFCAGGQPLVVRHLEHSSVADCASAGPLPLGGPLISWSQQRLVYLVVTTDRTGADITAYRCQDEVVETVHVEGSNDEIERNAPGGAAALRYQHRAEDSWRHNAEEVAAAVTTMADYLDPELILVTGDVRAVQLLQHALPERLEPVVQRLASLGTRGADGSAAVKAAEIAQRLQTAIVAARQKALAHWSDEHGREGLASSGADATAAALREGRLATLFVAYDLANRRNGWCGSEPNQVAAEAHELAECGIAGHPAPLADALIRAAYATGADVLVIDETDPGCPADGVAGLLRFA